MPVVPRPASGRAHRSVTSVRDEEDVGQLEMSHASRAKNVGAEDSSGSFRPTAHCNPHCINPMRFTMTLVPHFFEMRTNKQRVCGPNRTISWAIRCTRPCLGRRMAHQVDGNAVLGPLACATTVCGKRASPSHTAMKQICDTSRVAGPGSPGRRTERTRCAYSSRPAAGRRERCCSGRRTRPSGIGS